MDWYDKALTAANTIKKEFEKTGYNSADKSIIIGSGASKILDHCQVKARLPFRVIPHMPNATFHQGEFIWAQTDRGTDLIILNGRLHFYEGYSAQEITFPTRILALLGIKQVIMTNASGGLNPSYQAGELVLVRDHINLMPEHPLRGPNDERFGLRFPDMSDAYDSELRHQIRSAFMELNNEQLNEGVYVGFQGPSLETPAEYKYLHIIGGDMVGMSTVPEVIVANHSGIKTAVISIVTNICYPPEAITETTLEEVITIAETAAHGLAAVILKTLDNLA